VEAFPVRDNFLHRNHRNRWVVSAYRLNNVKAAKLRHLSLVVFSQRFFQCWVNLDAERYLILWLFSFLLQCFFYRRHAIFALQRAIVLVVILRLPCPYGPHVGFAFGAWPRPLCHLFAPTWHSARTTAASDRILTHRHVTLRMVACFDMIKVCMVTHFALGSLLLLFLEGLVVVDGFLFLKFF